MCTQYSTVVFLSNVLTYNCVSFFSLQCSTLRSILSSIKWLVDVDICFAMQRCRKYQPEAQFLLCPFPSSSGWSCLSCGIKVLVLYLLLYLSVCRQMLGISLTVQQLTARALCLSDQFKQWFYFHSLCAQSCIVQLDYIVIYM